ncbi:hypothetical protein WG947_05220 [Pontibacter sp. H259]|uniref:hypothetical protein n=1 Tax=Pontibacter sp. H259 TaxID=3133421 RepID=UPI0030C1A23E
MRILSLFLLLAGFAGCDSDSMPAPAARKYIPTDIDPDSAEFRYGRWGDRYEDIIYRESKAGNQPVAESKDSLAYIDEENKHTAFYYFTNSRLTHAKRTHRVWAEQVWAVYYWERMRDKLIQYHYGTPVSLDYYKWRDDEALNTYVFRESEYGYAVANGLLVCVAQWETERETISLMMDGKDGKIRLTEKHTAK